MKPLNILLAVDDSEASLHACRLVAAYAGDRSAIRVKLLNVQRPPLRIAPGAGIEHAALEAAARVEGERELAPGRALLEASGHRPEILVRIGPMAATILDAAQQCDNCVIVMGSGRHGPLGGYAIGSVALRVAPGAHCPVVLVRPGVKLPREAGVRLRVAAPVDGSPESVQVVRRLVQCAGLLGHLHVDLVHFRDDLTPAADLLSPKDNALVQDWSGRQFDAALGPPEKMLADAGISHEVHRLTGDPRSGIAVFASQQGAELIAMGTRGTGVMNHLLLGSVALKTALEGPVPVALMR